MAGKLTTFTLATQAARTGAGIAFVYSARHSRSFLGALSAGFVVGIITFLMAEGVTSIFDNTRSADDDLIMCLRLLTWSPHTVPRPSIAPARLLRRRSSSSCTGGRPLSPGDGENSPIQKTPGHDDFRHLTLAD